MLTLNNQLLTFEDIYRVAANGETVGLGAAARRAVQQSRTVVEQALADGQQLYGINTGFGALKHKTISNDDIHTLQQKLIMSHAVGVGKPLDKVVVRAMMCIIANYLSKGHSGVRPEVVETLLAMLNKDICPVVPEKGSVGSSGDLAPSAHIALVLIGQGEALYEGATMPGSEALQRAGIPPVRLEAKEGLALINNTACMAATGVVCMQLAARLAAVADMAGALSAEALRSGDQAFMAAIHELKPHPGQVQVAARLRRLLSGSTLINREGRQDQYSIRCIPQIHGGIREAMAYVERVLNTEINSVTDNPLVVEDGGTWRVVSGGNFHGEAIALAMDTLGIALSEFANTADRRIASLLDPANNNGLPAFLIENEGLNSGLMILQYTSAALASENKVLAHPSSVDSIPTSANVEDLVSMGNFSARKAREIAWNVANVLAIELITAAQGVELRRAEGAHPGKGTTLVMKEVRSVVPFFSEDSVYYPYMKELTNYIMAADSFAAVEACANGERA
jgi:histidine ammonia-lyase